MKKLTQTLMAAGALSASALFAHADPAPKICVADVQKIFNTHYSTVAETAKLNSDKEKAQSKLDQMKKDAQELYDQYKQIAEGANNPTATADAKSRSQADAQKKQQEVQLKMQDIQNFTGNVQADLQKRIMDFRTNMMEDISRVVITVAKRHDATLVVDKSGPTALGIPPVIYADPSYDITDEVIAEINKNKPAGAASAPAPSSSSEPTAPSGSGSLFNVPSAPGK